MIGQLLDECGEHGPVRLVQACSGVSAAQNGDLVAQHEELDVLGGGRAVHQEDQSKHLPEDQVQKPQRHAGIMSDQRSPLVSDSSRDFWHPTAIQLARHVARIRSDSSPTPKFPGSPPDCPRCLLLSAGAARW